MTIVLSDRAANEAKAIWQARVNKDCRFYFKIEDDTCFVTDVIPHPK